MNFRYYTAKRFLYSKKDSRFVSFITYISVAGIALGVATLIIAVSILNGFEKEIKDKVAGLLSHIQVTSFLSDGLSNYNEAIKKIKTEIPDVTGISPYVQKEAVIRYKENVDGIVLKGIVQETELSATKSKILAGEYNVKPVDSVFSRLLIGDKLAKKLNLSIGSKVVVFGLQGIPTPLNPPKLKQFYVSGIYETGLRDYDDIIIYTDLQTGEKIFSMDNNVTGIEININDIGKVESVVSKMKNFLEYPYYARSMFKIYRGLFTWVELQKAPTPIILGLIIIVATFNIVGTLLMLILEKTQSIGILRSLGASASDIMKIFIFDGMLIGIIGVILGNIIGIGLSLMELNYKFFKLPDIYYMKSVPVLLQPNVIILISSITLILIFLATLIPAYIASRFEPVKSLRFV